TRRLRQCRTPNRQSSRKYQKSLHSTPLKITWSAGGPPAHARPNPRYFEQTTTYNPFDANGRTSAAAPNSGGTPIATLSFLHPTKVNKKRRRLECRPTSQQHRTTQTSAGW